MGKAEENLDRELICFAVHVPPTKTRELGSHVDLISSHLVSSLISPLTALHQEGLVAAGEVGQEVEVEGGAQVVRVRHEHVLHPRRQELFFFFLCGKIKTEKKGAARLRRGAEHMRCDAAKTQHGNSLHQQSSVVPHGRKTIVVLNIHEPKRRSSPPSPHPSIFCQYLL